VFYKIVHMSEIVVPSPNEGLKVNIEKPVPLARPYWWEDVPRLAATSRDDAPFPASVDVLIVGGGLTGTSAAYELATAGRSVLVLDAAAVGSGASSRNAGMVGRYLKYSFEQLMAARGLNVAKSIFGETQRVYEECIARIQGEGMACGLRKQGRVIGAVSPAHRERLYREWELRGRYLGEAFRRLDEPRTEIASGCYHGGILILDNAAVQPALYTEAMRRRAEAAGATIRGGCAVTGYVREADGCFQVATERGTVVARDLIIATNGLTDSRLPDFSDRLAPINALMISTEELPADLVASHWPQQRTYHDNRRNSNYMQVSPDGRRLIFGGRTGLHRHPTPQAAEALRQEMIALFPALHAVGISHVWTGRCAVSADLFPHYGVRNGVHFALGYCFSGLAMAPYLGGRVARLVLARDEGDSCFRCDALKPMPWLARQEALMPLVMHYYRWRDRPAPLAA
jgi:glycine/D-amino acid oxidase-like deaminating enzyme